MAERGDGPAGELEGAAARLEWDQMPPNAPKSLAQRGERPAQPLLLYRNAVQK